MEIKESGEHGDGNSFPGVGRATHRERYEYEHHRRDQRGPSAPTRPRLHASVTRDDHVATSTTARGNTSSRGHWDERDGVHVALQLARLDLRVPAPLTPA